MFAFHHQQTIAAHDDRFRCDGLGARKHRDFDFKASDFVGRNWRKSGIVQGGVDGGAYNRVRERIRGFHLAYAPAELAASMKCHERACGLMEERGGSRKIQNPFLDDRARNRAAR